MRLRHLLSRLRIQQLPWKKQRAATATPCQTRLKQPRPTAGSADVVVGQRQTRRIQVTLMRQPRIAISLAAYASPMTIATQLNVLEDPFWHGYFLAIAAQQVGEPIRVADPTARSLPGKEEAEPE